MYHVRNAVPEDLTRILEIYAQAREFMAKTGNPNQWGKTHPPKEQLQEDILGGQLYVVEGDGTIHGVFAYLTGEDPTYGYIEEGAWLSNTPYGTIHRVAADGSGSVFTAVLQYAVGRNPHVRIDTHHDNHVMQHVVTKHGFRRCGIIYLEDGDPRIAYERL